MTKSQRVPGDGGYTAYTAGRITDPFVADDLVATNGSVIDEARTTEEWMPLEIRLIATTLDFIKKADDVTKEGRPSMFIYTNFWIKTFPMLLSPTCTSHPPFPLINFSLV